MARTIQELQALEIDQLKRRGFYHQDEKEILLRLGEEVGEVMEAVRENQSSKELGYEMVDVFWQLMKLAELKGIDFEQAFLEKLAENEKRPLG